MISKESAFLMTLSALAERLTNTYLGRHIKGQLIRCSTSVASNYRAAKLGQTKAVFISSYGAVSANLNHSIPGIKQTDFSLSLL